MNLLIIEDDKVALKTLQGSLENLGHIVHTAESGEVAINLIESEAFDLIISDIMMPGISGLSLVSVLRTVKLCNVPIVMMSALHNKALLDSVFEAGANDFILKPFTMQDITQKLSKYDPKSQEK
jgi:CheY-like chemotaxis protein